MFMQFTGTNCWRQRNLSRSRRASNARNAQQANCAQFLYLIQMHHKQLQLLRSIIGCEKSFVMEKHHLKCCCRCCSYCSTSGADGIDVSQLDELQMFRFGHTNRLALSFVVLLVFVFNIISSAEKNPDEEKSQR